MKNWTLRQRILASFAVIIAIMLLMVVVSYSRLLKIETSENSVRDDAIPGVYYSSMIRGAWVDSYLRIQEMLGLKEGQGISGEDVADFKGYEARVQAAMADYRATVTTEEDKVEYAAFEKLGTGIITHESSTQSFTRSCLTSALVSPGSCRACSCKYMVGLVNPPANLLLGDTLVGGTSRCICCSSIGWNAC